MTEEDAVKLAEQCGGENINGKLFYMTTTQLAMFADSVQLDEREKCAMICEAEKDGWAGCEYDMAAKDCAASIRPQSTKPSASAKFVGIVFKKISRP